MRGVDCVCQRRLLGRRDSRRGRRGDESATKHPLFAKRFGDGDDRLVGVFSAPIVIFSVSPLQLKYESHAMMKGGDKVDGQLSHCDESYRQFSGGGVVLTDVGTVAPDKPPRTRLRKDRARSSSSSRRSDTSED